MIALSKEVDRTSLARIEVASDPNFERDLVVLDRVTEFSYTYDVLQMGDPFSATVPNPRGEWDDVAMPGWSARFWMANPAVAGGAWTLKARGIVTNRDVGSDNSGGTVIRIGGADMGWHLMNNDAPLWFNLRGVTLEKLAQACVHPEKVLKKETDPGWGFSDEIDMSNVPNRTIKRKLPFSSAEQQGFREAVAGGGMQWVQVQPGQKIADLLIQYARRIGVLVNVTVEGKLQFFLPDYAQPLEFSVHYPRDRRQRELGNVLDAKRSDSLDGLYTHVTVVGECPIRASVAGGVSTFAPQFANIYGKAGPEDWPTGTTALPFRRRIHVSDGEITQKPRRRALWQQRRGLFDASSLTYLMRGHHQGGKWWEADTMCSVSDEVSPASGPRYVSAVNCTRTMQDGDRTTITLREPNLLDEIPLFS